MKKQQQLKTEQQCMHISKVAIKRIDQFIVQGHVSGKVCGKVPGKVPLGVVISQLNSVFHFGTNYVYCQLEHVK